MSQPFTVCYVALALAWVCPAASVAQQGDSTASGNGLYTTAQARRGEEQYLKACKNCHTPESFTETFVLSWTGAPVSVLLDLLSRTMPEDRPGSLRRAEYVDLVAYIFELNGLPPGRRELPVEQAQLDTILIQRRP